MAIAVQKSLASGKVGIDRGSRNVVTVFFSVVGGLFLFYAYLVYGALAWSPSFFVEGAEVERSAGGVAGNATEEVDIVRRGRLLYHRVGCALCHGMEGRGGVKNPNYIKEEKTPALDLLAERLFLHEREDAAAMIASLADGNKAIVADELDVPRAAAVAAQYESVRKIVVNGNPAGKKSPEGTTPFDMPAWRNLSENQIRAIVAYLLSLYPWEREE